MTSGCALHLHLLASPTSHVLMLAADRTVHALTLTLLIRSQLPADPNSQALAFIDGGVVPASISALQLLQSCSPAIRSQPLATCIPPGKEQGLGSSDGCQNVV